MIAGGLGGLGRVTAQWFVNRGAKNLVLLSRSGPKSHDAQELIQELRAQGAHIETPLCDVTDAQSLQNVLSRCAKTMPPIGGCIQSTMVLRVSVLNDPNPMLVL